jgi:hypothetical protein
MNCHSPCPVENAVFSLSGCSATYQYLLFRSSAENHFASASVSKVSSILGSGKQSFCDVIQSSVVYAEAKAAVFLLDDHHR